MIKMEAVVVSFYQNRLDQLFTRAFTFENDY